MSAEAELNKYPNVHAAYQVYMSYFSEPPLNATHLVKWCKKQGISDISYANVNKYLRIKRQTGAAVATKKKKKAVVKHSNERYKDTGRDFKKSHTVSQASQRFLTAMADTGVTRTSQEFSFDKGETRSRGFSAFTQKFEKLMKEDAEAASRTHTAFRKASQGVESEDNSHHAQKGATGASKKVDKRGIQEEAKEEMKSVIDEALEKQLMAESVADVDMDEDSDVGTDDDYEEPGDPPVEEADEDAGPVRPWLRLKPRWSPSNRMSRESPETVELIAWLNKNKFGQFVDKLIDCGVEALADLKILETDEEVQELAGPDGINMGVVYRRKFIKAVNKLRKEPDNPALSSTGNPVSAVASQPSASKSSSSSKKSESGGSSKSGSSKGKKKGKSGKKGLSKEEQDALNQLVDTIKAHTTSLRGAREELAKVKQAGDVARAQVAELFDKAMGILVVRRNILNGDIDEGEKEASEAVKQRVMDLQKSAKALLKCKQTIEKRFKSSPASPERQAYVQGEVSEALANTPDEQMEVPSITFSQGKTPLLEFIEHFGSIDFEEAGGSSKDEY